MQTVRPTLLVSLFRLLRFVIHLAYGTLLGSIFPLLKRSQQRRVLRCWSRELLSILNVQLDTRGYVQHGIRPVGLLVANHVSWLDVVAMNAALPNCFVAKSELRDWPLIGWLCQRARTLFIERTDRRDALRINQQLTALLNAGNCVTIFPEGTTTGGHQPQYFHSSLLQSAIDSQTEIHPIAIRYHDRQGNLAHTADFVGNMNFVSSLWNVLTSPTLHVTLTRLPSISSTNEHRRSLARAAHSAISLALAHPQLAFHPLADTSTCWNESEPAYPSLYALMLPGNLHLSEQEVR